MRVICGCCSIDDEIELERCTKFAVVLAGEKSLDKDFVYALDSKASETLWP
jgi:hypothetical protein